MSGINNNLKTCSSTKNIQDWWMSHVQWIYVFSSSKGTTLLNGFTQRGQKDITEVIWICGASAFKFYIKTATALRNWWCPHQICCNYRFSIYTHAHLFIRKRGNHMVYFFVQVVKCTSLLWSSEHFCAINQYICLKQNDRELTNVIMARLTFE